MGYHNYQSKLLVTFNSKYVFNNILAIALIILAAIILIYWAKVKYKYAKGSFLLLLFLYHTAISIFLYYSTLHGIADARLYYSETVRLGGNQWWASYGYGFKFIYFFLYPLVHYLKLTYLSCFFFFNFLGFVGLLFLYLGLGSLTADSPRGTKYLQLALFIPGLSYWTGFIGKDPLIFLALSFILFSIINIKRRFILFLLAFALMAHIRPYIAAVTLSSLLVALVLNKDLNFLYKFLFIIIVAAMTFVTATVFVKTYGLEQASIAQGEQLINATQFDWGGGSGIDISHYNFVFKVLTFLYRPLFFDAHNVLSFLSSCENLIYIYLTLLMLSPIFFNYMMKDKTFFWRFNLVFLLIGTIMLSQTNANLGTIVRKKVMILPSLIAVIVIYMRSRDRQSEKLRAYALQRKEIGAR